MAKKNRKAPRRDDELWKGALEEVFDDFLRFFFPNADELFAMDKRFTFLDKEFNKLFPSTEDSGKVRFVDKLVRVHLKDGGSRFILVHVEVQGKKGNEDLSARMFRYYYLARDKHNVSITAFAILIDDVKGYLPLPYRDEYLGTKLSYEFNTYKLLDQDEAELRKNPNIFAVIALVVLLALKYKNANDQDLKSMKLDLVMELTKRKVSLTKHNAVMMFLTYYVNFENPQMFTTFEKEVEQLTGRTVPMTVKEILVGRAVNQAREEVRLEALEEKQQIARNLINKGISLEIISDATSLSIEELATL
ncbi:hypothetical protein LPB86_08740 [Pedobacter sp. MC2016-14]|uniref:hypothetical protein n=1 Tax=Pedobacter sp. MC2016-14 TaxID=2897327 RepID=UPI001E398E09|nr:hypothetical protein [Pedobacter sp. MC2016-14]MCD0488314.1 hypothetical protein [Pedobacter sp. MC2016-14]